MMIVVIYCCGIVGWVLEYSIYGKSQNDFLMKSMLRGVNVVNRLPGLLTANTDSLKKKHLWIYHMWNTILHLKFRHIVCNPAKPSVLRHAATPDITLSSRKQMAEAREWLYFSQVLSAVRSHQPGRLNQTDLLGASSEHTCWEETCRRLFSVTGEGLPPSPGEDGHRNPFSEQETVILTLCGCTRRHRGIGLTHQHTHRSISDSTRATNGERWACITKLLSLA